MCKSSAVPVVYWASALAEQRTGVSGRRRVFSFTIATTMDSQQNTEQYLQRIHELIASYNEHEQAAEQESIALLTQARTLIREALSHDQNNEELIDLHVELVIVLSQYFLAKALDEESYTQSLIEPEEFVKRWGGDDEEEFVSFDAATTEEWNIGEDSARFLAEAGLPASAAPFLSFGETGRLWDVWNFGEDTEYARELFSQYIALGTDGSGNPLCIDEENNGIVVALDHDFGFQAVTFVNSSVQQLAECLLVYRVALEEAQRLGTEEAVAGTEVESESGEAIAEWVEQEFMRIDSRAMSKECFWRIEVEALRSESAE